MPTQTERTTAMRHRLLEATVECLVEFGYANTTTTRVVERAGVTRGAQVHHFPTKAALVAAAIRHLAAKRAALAFEERERVQAAPDPIDAALDLLWDLHQGPIFAATMELWVAARTDAELREQLSLVEPATTASIVEIARTILPGTADHPEFAHGVYTAMDTIRGLLLASFIYPQDRSKLDARWQRAKSHLRRTFREDLPNP